MDKELIIKLREEGKTFGQIGKEIGRSRQRVHQILTGYKSPYYNKTTRIRISDSDRLINETIKSVDLLEKVINKQIDLSKENVAILIKIKRNFRSSGGRDRIRTLARIRDNYKCQICGLEWKKGMRNFDVHHIDCDPTKTRIIDKIEDLNNLITLCHKCHLSLPEHREKIRETWNKKLSTS